MNDPATGKEDFSWHWPGLWALNVPALLLLWQALLSRTLYVPIGGYQFAMAAALVWLFLSVERWVVLAENPARAEVLGMQRATAVRMWAMIGASLALVAVFRATYWEVVVTVGFVGVAGGYLLLHLRRQRFVREWISAEFALAALSVAPMLLFIAANSVFSPLRLVLPGLLVFFLFFYYFALQVRWSEPGMFPGMKPLLNTPIGPVCRGLPLAMMLVGGFLGLTGRIGVGSIVLIAVAVSAGLLIVLEFREKKIGAVQCRWLSDLALITPLPALLFGI